MKHHINQQKIIEGLEELLKLHVNKVLEVTSQTKGSSEIVCRYETVEAFIEVQNMGINTDFYRAQVDDHINKLYAEVKSK